MAVFLMIYIPCLLLLEPCLTTAGRSKDSMTEQEKEDWKKMEDMLQKEMQKTRQKYARKSDTCQQQQTMETRMLMPSSEDETFEDVFKAHLCKQCKEVAKKLEKGMTSADKRKRYGRHLGEDEVTELSYKICDKKVEDMKTLCKELVEKNEETFFERYQVGPEFGLEEKICQAKCNGTKEHDEL
ncbi:unnamed protein product [Lymnaea stagnalis]|uniref:Saposin B-type domain-containing protein n=1 Tax=Lymnaea stagnalis TaxID=6523 RepID=A0AAV2H386_LYMST